MSSLNHAFDIIEELSTEERFAVYDFLKNKLSERFEDIIISEHLHSQNLYKTGKIEAETVDEMFERLGLS